MKTITEKWNEQAGWPIFATEIDEYGCPENGWSLPAVTMRTDAKSDQVTVTAGVFMVGSGEQMVGEKYNLVVPFAEMRWNDPAWMHKLSEAATDALVRRLVELHDKEYGTDAIANYKSG